MEGDTKQADAMLHPEEQIEDNQVVVFEIQNEKFAIDINFVHGIIKPQDITRVPNAADFIDGVINLRGRINVVADLGKKIGFPEREYNEDTRIVVLEFENDQFGVRVDSVSGTIKFKTNDVQPTPSLISKKLNGEFIRGIYTVSEDDIIMILDIQKVFPDTTELKAE